MFSRRFLSLRPASPTSWGNFTVKAAGRSKGGRPSSWPLRPSRKSTANCLPTLDRTGLVNGVFRRLKVAKQAEIIRAGPLPLPNRGPYPCVVVDFPWADDTGRYDDPSHRLVTPYPSMTLEEICAFPLTSILAPDAVVWLWATNYHVSRGIHNTVLDANVFAAEADAYVGQAAHRWRRLAARANRAVHHGVRSARPCRHAHEPEHFAASATAQRQRSLAEAARVL